MILRKMWKTGEPFVWLTGGGLAISLLMITGLIGLILWNGLPAFWPRELVQLDFQDGTKAMGIVRLKETYKGKDRLQLQVGNRDLYGQDFRWIEAETIAGRETPAEAFLVERREWGPFVGFLKEIRSGNATVGADQADVLHERAAGLWSKVRALEKHVIGDNAYAQEQIRLKLRRLHIGGDIPEVRKRLEEEQEILRKEFEKLSAERATLTADMNRDVAVFESVDGQRKEIPFSGIVRMVRPNSNGFFGNLGVYLARFWEFVWDDPRESNTEGGVFPAIFGTVMMVFLMTVAVVPLGVLAALYLREYAKQGFVVRLVRVAVNNLAGVPSIVFGVFGLGFFVYFVGGTIDSLFYPESLPTPTYGTGGILWASLTLALLTVPVVIVATEEGLAAVPQDIRSASLALGATKFETTLRVVLPSAMPGILTGVILAMARAAGEVAPLMITGVVKLAPSLPLDDKAPFVHLDRKFMHLGFHIYDVGFQSPNVEAARPMVYMTTILLLAIVVALNLVAIVVRNRLRRKYRSSLF